MYQRQKIKKTKNSSLQPERYMQFLGTGSDKRILWIDFAKVIGIWLVILGHMNIPIHMDKFIFAFHMPLFFFISGYLEKDNKNFKQTFLAGLRTLVLPYVMLYGLFYLYWFFVDFLRHPEIYEQEPLIETLLKPIVGMFFGIGRDTKYSIMLNVPLWFLPGLFFTKIIHKLIKTIVQKHFDYYIIGIGFVIGIMFLVKFIDKPLLFSIDCAILAFPFFGIGYIIRKGGTITLLQCNNIKHLIRNIVIAIVGFFIIIIAVKYNGQADVNNFIYGRDNMLFYVLGFIGIISIICISLLYKKEAKIITTLSNGTIIILASHDLINSYLYRIVNKLNIEFDLTILIIIISILNIALTIIPIKIIQKHIPMLMGGRK